MFYSGLCDYCCPSAVLCLHIKDRERQLTYTNFFLQAKSRLNISNFKAQLKSMAFFIHKAPAVLLVATPIKSRSRLIRNSYFLNLSPYKENSKVMFLIHFSLYHSQCLKKHSILSLSSSLRNTDAVCPTGVVSFNLYASP